MSPSNKDIIRNLRENAPSDLDIRDGLYSDDCVYPGFPMIGDVKGPSAFINIGPIEAKNQGSGGDPFKHGFRIQKPPPIAHLV